MDLEVKAKILDRPRAKEWASMAAAGAEHRRDPKENERRACLRRRAAAALESQC